MNCRNLEGIEKVVKKGSDHRTFAIIYRRRQLQRETFEIREALCIGKSSARLSIHSGWKPQCRRQRSNAILLSLTVSSDSCQSIRRKKVLS